LWNFPGPKIWRLRSVPEDQWFPRGHDECDPRFWTIPQESFYATLRSPGFTAESAQDASVHRP
jgi:hypothetical protein